MSEEHPDLTLAYMTGYHKGRAVAERDTKDADQRKLVTAAWLAGYWDAGYTNDSAYADTKAAEFYDAAMSAESKEVTKLNMTPLAQFLLDDALTDKTDWIDGGSAA